jgi:hypothetical protein
MKRVFISARSGLDPVPPRLFCVEPGRETSLLSLSWKETTRHSRRSLATHEAAVLLCRQEFVVLLRQHSCGYNTEATLLWVTGVHKVTRRTTVGWLVQSLRRGLLLTGTHVFLLLALGLGSIRKSSSCAFRSRFHAFRRKNLALDHLTEYKCR